MTTTQPRRRLPDGFVARLRPDLLGNTQGGVLVGGSPFTVMRLSPAARRYLGQDRVVVRDRSSELVAMRLIDANLADPEPPGPTATPAELTVVIPVRDRPEQLDRCLTALRGVSCVVVDDHSLGSREIAAVAARHGAQLVALPSNIGPAGARNEGLRYVDTQYVAFVDSDVEVPESELLQLTRHFSDRRLALVGPRIRGLSRSSRPRWFENYDQEASSLDLNDTGARVRPGSSVAWLPGACLVGRTHVVKAIGGFDERMRVGEDVDLVWRLVKGDWVVRYDPTGTAAHDTRTTLAAWLGRKFVYGTGGAALARRHGGWTAPAILSPAGGIGAAVVLMRNRALLPIAPLCLALSTRAVSRALPPTSARRGAPLSLQVSARALGWALRQESALLLRHWWPAAALSAATSRTARRAIITALVLDAFLAAERGSARTLPRDLVCRRLDDMAYGAGLWWGAIRHHNPSCLLPRRRPSGVEGVQQDSGRRRGHPAGSPATRSTASMVGCAGWLRIARCLKCVRFRSTST